MTTILTIAIVIGLAIATTIAQQPSPVAAITAQPGPTVAARSRRGSRRNNNRRQSTTTVSRRPARKQTVQSGAGVLSGAIKSISPAPERGQNAFASAFAGLAATAVYIDNTAVVFSSAGMPDDYDLLVKMLAGRPRTARIAGYAKPARQSMYDVFGVDAVVEDPDNALFEGINTLGEHTNGVDVLMLDDRSLTEYARLIEVPTTGYCMRCRDRVYRRDLELVEIDRYGGGVYQPWDERYLNATRGKCERCDATVMRFGTQLTEMVRVIDHEADYVSPKVRPERPRAKTPKGALPHPLGFCMSCRETVVRENPRVTTYRNGRPATVGTCEICDADVWRAGGPVLPDVVVHVQAAHTDERQAFCGDPAARVIGRDPEDADSLFYLESLDPTLFVLRCQLCEFYDLDREIQQENQAVAAATVVETAHVCPDEFGVADGPVPSYHPDVIGSGGRNRSESADGVSFSFTAYSRSREPWYTCYWPWSDCRQPAGWHGFRHQRGQGSVDYHLCARHWRVAMGYSRE